MTALRRLVHRHRRLASLFVAAALALKLVVAAGFMPVVAPDGTITVRICSGMQMAPMTIAAGLPDRSPGHGDHRTPAKAEMPCAFAGLALPMLAGADPLLLALAIAFVLALAIRLPAPPPVRRTAYLRPPLRGPPTAA